MTKPKQVEVKMDRRNTNRRKEERRKEATAVADSQIVEELVRRSAEPDKTVAASLASFSIRIPRLRWFVAAAALLVVVSTTVFACLHSSKSPATPTASFTLEAEPATVDESGDILLRIRVVPAVR